MSRRRLDRGTPITAEQLDAMFEAVGDVLDTCTRCDREVPHTNLVPALDGRRRTQCGACGRICVRSADTKRSTALPVALTAAQLRALDAAPGSQLELLR